MNSEYARTLYEIIQFLLVWKLEIPEMCADQTDLLMRFIDGTFLLGPCAVRKVYIDFLSSLQRALILLDLLDQGTIII